MIGEETASNCVLINSSGNRIYASSRAFAYRIRSRDDVKLVLAADDGPYIWDGKTLRQSVMTLIKGGMFSMVADAQDGSAPIQIVCGDHRC